ncbi:MFS transporter [Halomonas shantousis]
MPSPSRQSPASQALLPSTPMVWLMAIATGVSVANIYYAQPLLDVLSEAFGIAHGRAGLIVTLTQLGYALGILLIVPLGDLLDRRRLVPAVSLGAALAAATAAMAPNFTVFIVASLAMGGASVVAQILVPLAAHLAADEVRGRVVGQVMTGLLLGILLARTVSGALADFVGWRAVFWVACVSMLAVAISLGRLLPDTAPQSRQSYGALVVTSLRLLLEEPVLRRRCVYGAMGFAAFAALWTALPFLLAEPPFGYRESVIGAFGLLGAAGALAASQAGRLHDAGRSGIATGGFLALIAVTFILLGMWPASLLVLVIGIALFDVGVQGNQILNQSRIYSLRPDARSRITTAYMTCYFLGGSLGSASSAWLYGVAGWRGVMALGVGFMAVALIVWGGARLSERTLD